MPPPDAPDTIVPAFSTPTPDAPDVVVAATGTQDVAEITVSGVTAPISGDFTLSFQGYLNGKPFFSTGGLYGFPQVGWVSGSWIITTQLGFEPLDQFTKTSEADSPVGLTGWTASGDAEGTPTVTGVSVAGPSSGYIAPDTSPVSPGSAPALPGAALGTAPGEVQA